jgi:hypothetical protein
MSFGGGGTTYQWQEQNQKRGPGRVQRPTYDTMIRGLLGQMVRPPETAISVPLQQAVSNLQSGNFKVGGSMVDRLAAKDLTGVPGGSASTGFPAGSLLPSAAGGQQGLQTREQLGLPSRESYFTFMPKPEDIEKIGLSPIRSSVLNKEKLGNQIDRLQTRIATREAAGKPHAQATRRLEKAQKQLKKNTGDLYL